MVTIQPDHLHKYNKSMFFIGSGDLDEDDVIQIYILSTASTRSAANNTRDNSDSFFLVLDT